MDNKKFLDLLHREGSINLICEHCDISRFELMEDDGETRNFMEDLFNKLTDEKNPTL